MKRIIAILTLSLAFSLSSNAQASLKSTATEQTKEVNYKEGIIKDMMSLTDAVKLDEQVAKDITSLLFMREEAVSNAKSIEEKKSLFERYGKKLLAGLTPDQLIKLQENKELYNKLTQFPVTK